MVKMRVYSLYSLKIIMWTFYKSLCLRMSPENMEMCVCVDVDYSVSLADTFTKDL